jgi:hypothetical protein
MIQPVPLFFQLPQDWIKIQLVSHLCIARRNAIKPGLTPWRSGHERG